MQHPLLAAVITYSHGTDLHLQPKGCKGACLLITLCMDKSSTVQLLCTLVVGELAHFRQVNSHWVSSGMNDSACCWHIAISAWGWCWARCAQQRCHAYI